MRNAFKRVFTKMDMADDEMSAFAKTSQILGNHIKRLTNLQNKQGFLTSEQMNELASYKYSKRYADYISSNHNIAEEYVRNPQKFAGEYDEKNNE